MIYILYKKSKTKLPSNEFNLPSFKGINIEYKNLLFLKRSSICGEDISVSTLLFRQLISLITKNKAKIFYVKDNDKVIHTSYVIPKCIKFSFLKDNDLEIGPCYTDPDFRGKGIYPCVLNYICSCYGKNKDFYMIANEKNFSSIKGIEKSGFEKNGLVKKTWNLKYKIIK